MCARGQLRPELSIKGVCSRGMSLLPGMLNTLF
jgi:hypothetical protein